MCTQVGLRNEVWEAGQPSLYRSPWQCVSLEIILRNTLWPIGLDVERGILFEALRSPSNTLEFPQVEYWAVLREGVDIGRMEE